MLNIRHIRQRLKMSQESFAEAIGVTQGAVSQWENGATKPSFKAVFAISKLLNITIEQLLAEETA